MAKMVNGPSPRVWGLHYRICAYSESSRAIPTCVGTTDCRPRAGGADQGHPHVCGDYASCSQSGPPGAGHPHVCGDYGRGGIRRIRGGRAIPTCVGTTLLPSGLGRAPRAIPTCVGTTGPWAMRRSGRGGPSPRVWGLLGLLCLGLLGHRAIPTCVGTTTLAHKLAQRLPGHPHVCGDYCKPPRTASQVVGPSPRVWGLRVAAGVQPQLPTGHPHVCGDYVLCSSVRCGSTGPSPRVWGLR